MTQTYTVKQVAEILGYSTNSIYTFLKEKRIKGIRVGRGRFRIPQTELDRLLHKASVAPMVSPAVSVEAPVYIESQASRMEVPSLFEWFVGISSILTGFSMSLFSKYQEASTFQKFEAWIPLVMAALISGGVGLLLTDILNFRKTFWRKLFVGTLVFAYICLTLFLGLANDWEGVFIYGVFTILILLSPFFLLTSTASLSVIAEVASLLLPLVVLALPPRLEFIGILSRPLVAPLLYLAFLAIVGVALFYLFSKNKPLGSRVLTIISGVVLASTSLWYASQMAWGRSLFLFLAALVVLITPSWLALHLSGIRDRRTVLAMFGLVLFIFLVAIASLKIIETTVLGYVSRQLVDKASYGRVFIEAQFGEAEKSLKSASQNPLWVEAVAKDNKELLSTLARALFEGSSVRRIAVTNSIGDVLVNYPYNETIANTNLFFRDYISGPVRTKTSYRSEAFVSVLGPPVMGIGVPVVGQKGEVKGVIAAVFDLVSLGNRIQEMASLELGEYFVVVDKNGRRIIHPNAKRLYEEVGEKDLVRRGIAGGQGFGRDYDEAGIQILKAYEHVGPGDWGIAVQAPVSNILRPTRLTIAFIFSVLGICTLLLGVFILPRRSPSTALRREQETDIQAE